MGEEEKEKGEKGDDGEKWEGKKDERVGWGSRGRVKEGRGVGGKEDEGEQRVGGG